MKSPSFVLRLLVPAIALLLARPGHAQTTYDAVYPVFRTYCGPCHTNAGSGGFNLAADDISIAYADSQLASYYLPGQTKGYASLYRIQIGDMPQGGGCTGNPVLDAGNTSCLTASEQALVQSWINDGQLGPVIPPGTPYCFGDGSGANCPCGNAGATGNGCANSVNASGARLAATGTPSVSADTLVLQGSQMPNSSALYFQGTLQTSGGNGSVFGDGLRCASGSVIRLGTKFNAAGSSQYPVLGDTLVSIRGAVPAGGATRHYQVWYRNAVAFCQPETFNLTNGLSVTWSP